MHFAIWIITLLLIGLWSLLAWGVHALLSIDLTLTAQVGPLLDRIPGAPWLDDYAPGWRDLVVASTELLQVSLDWIGGLAPMLVWMIWGLGVGGLVLCALLLSGVVALVRKTMPPTPPAPPTAAPVSR